MRQINVSTDMTFYSFVTARNEEKNLYKKRVESNTVSILLEKER